MPFFELFGSRQGPEAKIVLYIDEVCPGNPLRPEKSRTTQAVYWAMADLPTIKHTGAERHAVLGLAVFHCR